jgi:hypothetical protein
MFANRRIAGVAEHLLRKMTALTLHGTAQSSHLAPRDDFTRSVRIILILVAILASSLPAAIAQDESSDGRFVQGLRERQLFRLAESFCEKRLADVKLPLPQRADLVVHLSQTYVDHARSLPPDQADALWGKAFAATDDFARQFPQTGWRIVVRMQGALVLLARGELWRQRSEVTGDAARLISESQGYLRTAIKLLKGHADELASLLRDHRDTPSEPTRIELLSLERNLKFHLARAYRNQALCYADESPDRDNALRQALELSSALAGLGVGDPLAWQGRLEEILCLRLMKQYVAAERRWADLDSQRPPPEIALRAQAERIRLHLGQGRVDEAVKQAGAGRRIENVTDPELDFAHLEAHLAAWRAAARSQNKSAADAAQVRATEVVQTIEQVHAPYWARRAEALLASVITDAGLTGNLAVLVRAAQGYYRGKQFADAVRTYDEAAKLAREQKQPDKAFDFAYTAAVIEHEQQRHAEARERFHRLALEQPKNAKAAEAHLLAAFNAGQEARLEQPINLDEYTALLREHVRTWPKEGTANHARWQLGQCHEFQRRWADAIAVYRDIAVDHERFGQAVPAIARCYEAVLADLRAEGKPTLKLATEAAGYFERLVLPGEKPTWPERWSPAERAATLAACRFRLDSLPGDAAGNTGAFRRAEQFLIAALDGQPAPPADWKPAAQGLLLVAVAGQRQFTKGAELAKDLASAPVAVQLDALQRLADLSRSAGEEDRRSFGKLQAQAAEGLSRRRGELDDGGRKKLDTFAAQAVAASGDAKSAAEMFAKLAAANPKDGEIQEAYATVLVEIGDRPALDAALVKWREIERNSRTAAPRWFRAKYHLALVYFQLGDRGRAAEIIKVTQVLHPELGGAETKTRFAALLKQCE